MASHQHVIDFIFEQAGSLPGLAQRRMFGEYAIYLEGKVIALVCDDQLFLKNTPEGRALLAQVTEGQPFPGAKPWLLLVDEIEDRELLQRLFRTTAWALPEPKPKTPRRKR